MTRILQNLINSCISTPASHLEKRVSLTFKAFPIYLESTYVRSQTKKSQDPGLKNLMRTHLDSAKSLQNHYMYNLLLLLCEAAAKGNGRSHSLLLFTFIPTLWWRSAPSIWPPSLPGPPRFTLTWLAMFLPTMVRTSSLGATQDPTSSYW